MASRRPTARQGIQSIEVGATLLRALARASGPLMLRDLAAAAHMPAAKAHRYLVSLVRMGMVEQNAETGLYDLGAFALNLGLSAVARLEPVTVATPFLEALREKTGQTVALAVWANQGATIVRWLGADTPVAASLRVGSVMPLTRSATGRVFLSFLPRQATERQIKDELLDNERKNLDPRVIGQVEQVIRTTRGLGYAHTSDFIPGIAGAAAPVFDHTAALSMALIVLGYSKPFDAALTDIAGSLLRESLALSRRLGWQS